MPSKEGHPTAFISYAWDGEEHKQWVRDLATRLRSNGVDVKLDQWECAPGDQLPAFMETAIRENDFVLIVCTPKYKTKSDNRTGGAGYEGDIMTGEVFTTGNRRKFIPILCSGAWSNAAPSWLTGTYRIDLSDKKEFEPQYRDLLDTLHDRRDKAPPVGPVPPKNTSAASRSNTAGLNTAQIRAGQGGGLDSFIHRDAASDHDPDKFEPITVGEVIEELVGKPRNDGTPGCALFPISFRLSRPVPQRWGDLFVRRWDTTWGMHRHGIVRIAGNVLTLANTDWREMESSHNAMMKQCSQFANEQYVAELRAAIERAKQTEAKEQAWKDEVRWQARKYKPE